MHRMIYPLAKSFVNRKNGLGIGIIQVKLCGDAYGYAQPVVREVDEDEVCDVVLLFVKRDSKQSKVQVRTVHGIWHADKSSLPKIMGPYFHTMNVSIIDGGRQT